LGYRGESSGGKSTCLLRRQFHLILRLFD